MATWSKNLYSVRASIQGRKRDRQVGGPWKPTFNEAIMAFVEKMKRKGQEGIVLKNPMVARRATIEDQLEQHLPTDGNGIPYRRDFSLDSGVVSLLTAQGLTIQDGQQ
jgi:hypothetical protein